MSSNINNNQFSPFYKVRNLVSILRWMLGFPLKPTNEALNHFEFNPFLEYARHALFLCIPTVSTGYCAYVHMKQTQIWNPILAMRENITRVGISDLDLACMMSLSAINLVSNSIYLVSFKNRYFGLNRICNLLTEINQETWYAAEGSNFTSKSRNKMLYGRLIYIIGIFTLAVGMFASCWSAIILENISDSENIIYETPITEKVFFCVFIIMLYGSYVYPPMGISADFVVCYLVNETKESFDKFKLMIKSRSKHCSYGSCEKKSHTSNLDNDHIMTISR